ncbi:hypothetical protein [Nonlabens ponticola]|nr:hypothetical protein [Nonlabens ponticola]
MKGVDIEQKSIEIQQIISRYTKESFVCFFADFVRHHPERNQLSFSEKFKSKYKDSIYLIMLRLSSDEVGSEDFYYSEENDKILQKVGEILLEIVSFYLWDYSRFDTTVSKEDRSEMLIHELAFKDYFQNGVLDYREQELNKVIRLFKPYQDKIKERLGIDLKTLMALCEFSEDDYQRKAIASKSFLFDPRMKDFVQNAQAGKFEESLSQLPLELQDNFLDFFENPHSCLLFTKDDYYKSFNKKDVDVFCKLLSIDINDSFDNLFYSQPNPLEHKPIIKINNKTFLNVFQKQLPNAVYKLLYQVLTETEKEKEQLNLRRGKVILESQTQNIFDRFFSKAKNVTSYNNYYINSNPAEKDLLYIVNRIAFVIECKASRSREPWRNTKKATERIRSDFDYCIQKGYEQCFEVEQAILNDEAITIKSKNHSEVLNTSQIIDVFTIVVTSERFASLQIDLGLLLNKKSSEDFYPWSVCIDDLEIFLKTLGAEYNNRFKKFIDYLEFRELLHGRLLSRDELDVCAMFLKNPQKFKELCESDAYLVPDPYLQGYFDELYFSKKLNFKILDVT